MRGVDTSSSGFRLTEASIEKALNDHPDARALILSDPGNPTGAVLDREAFQAIIDKITSVRSDFLVIQDAPYAHQCISRPFTPLVSLDAPSATKLFTIFTLSKAGGTGFRVGATVTNDSEHLAPIIKRFSAKGPSIATPSQYAWKAYMSPVAAESDTLLAEVISQEQQSRVRENLDHIRKLCTTHRLSLASEYEGGSYCLLDLGNKKTGQEVFEQAMNRYALLIMPGYLTNLEMNDTHLMRLPLTLRDKTVYDQALALIGEMVHDAQP